MGIACLIEQVIGFHFLLDSAVSGLVLFCFGHMDKDMLEDLPGVGYMPSGWG